MTNQNEHVLEAARSTQQFYAEEMDMTLTLEEAADAFRTAADLWAETSDYYDDGADRFSFERGLEF